MFVLYQSVKCMYPHKHTMSYWLDTVQPENLVVWQLSLQLPIHMLIPYRTVVYNHWTGTVDWNGGMEWWNCKFSKIEVQQS